jgi:molybdopterin converting factor subunit 1
MRITVHLFARARDLAGTPTAVLDLPPPATVASLRRALAATYPRLAPLLEKSVLAVNDALAVDDLPLAADSEVALLPPVSGG